MLMLVAARSFLLYGEPPLNFFNVFAGYLQVVEESDFDLRSICDVGALTLGAVLINLEAARHFGRFLGDNSPKRS